LKNGNFCSSSRKANIPTTGIYKIFRGLKFEPVEAKLRSRSSGTQKSGKKCRFAKVSWQLRQAKLQDWLCTLLRIFLEKMQTINMTGINPQHRLHHLSLLPSGSDEVRDRLLRGGRSNGLQNSNVNPKEGIQPRIKRISGKGHR